MTTDEAFEVVVGDRVTILSGGPVMEVRAVIPFDDQVDGRGVVPTQIVRCVKFRCRWPKTAHNAGGEHVFGPGSLKRA